MDAKFTQLASMTHAGKRVACPGCDKEVTLTRHGNIPHHMIKKLKIVCPRSKTPVIHGN